MESGKARKPHEALKDLERAIQAYQPSTSKQRSLSFLAVSKAFEVAIEYTWKELKKTIEDRGLEAYSPKDVIREAANLELITEPEAWIRAINMRNLSVHDYFSIPEKDFVSEAETYLKTALKVFK